MQDKSIPKHLKIGVESKTDFIQIPSYTGVPVLEIVISVHCNLTPGKCR